MKEELKLALDRIPSSWEGLKLKDFKKILALEVSEDGEHDGLFDGVDNSLKLVSVFSGLAVSYLESQPIDLLLPLISKVSFFLKEPDVSKYKGRYLWKNIEEVTYNDYVLFLTCQQQPWENVNVIMKSFCKEELTDEEIEDMNMVEVHAGFFFLKKSVSKYLSSRLKLECKNLSRLTIKEILQTLFRRKKKASKNS